MRAGEFLFFRPLGIVWADVKGAVPLNHQMQGKFAYRGLCGCKRWLLLVRFCSFRVRNVKVFCYKGKGKSEVGQLKGTWIPVRIAAIDERLGVVVHEII